jgi:hypothetical protein
MSLVKYNNNSISSITSAGQLASGSLVPISEQTASGSASISFTTGIDSTYPIYKFEFINIHPSTASRPQFNLSTDGGSNYNVTKTTTVFNSYHNEADTSAALAYSPSGDLAQSTGVQRLGGTTDADNDTAMSGTLTLFNPSSTTFVKHFIIRTQQVSTAYSQELYIAGYGNTTSAINGIQFSQSSGTIETGKIKLYGIKDS